MLNTIGKFWKENKDTIKNIIILVAVPVTILAVMGVKDLNKFIDEKGLTDEYYGDSEQEEA